MLDAGVHVMTSGNHIWDKREVLEFIGTRAAADSPGELSRRARPGAGSFVFDGQRRRGRRRSTSWVASSCRPSTIRLPRPPREIARVRSLGARIIVVDFHAEATSEKIAMGWHLDGQVTAVVGTHTHVQTADERVLPGGTAYITDVGMTGPHDGVIGMDRTAVLSRFLTGMPVRLRAGHGRSAAACRGDHRRRRHGAGDRHLAHQPHIERD